MPSFRRRSSVIEADGGDLSPTETDHTTGREQALSLAEQAEADAAEAEAIAAAARARARAIRLRREAERDVEARSDTGADTETAEDAGAGNDVEVADPPDNAEVADAAEAYDAGARRRRLPRPGWKGVAATVVALLTVGCLAVSGYLIWHHRQAEALNQRSAEYAAAGRQSVVTLMSLDFNNAQADVQRIIDNSTGQFKDDFEMQAADFVKVAQESKVVTEVTVNSVAVQTMTDDSAVVLVAASSRVTNSAGANQDPRTWRLSVDLQREDGQIKMSKVEFVP